jgi:hypothetical protein
MAFFRSPLLRRIIYLIAFGMALFQLSHYARSATFENGHDRPVSVIAATRH